LPEAFALFKAEIDEKPEEVSKGFYAIYAKLKEDLKSG